MMNKEIMIALFNINQLLGFYFILRYLSDILDDVPHMLLHQQYIITCYLSSPILALSFNTLFSF